MKHLRALLLLSACLASLACDSGGDGGSPRDTATVAATSDATGGPPAGDRTGIAEVDAVIAAVAAGDAGALLARFRFQDVACTDQPGPGLPPPCRTAGPPGTPVSVFPVAACEDGWTSDAAPLVAHLLDAAPELHSVVRYGGPGAYDVLYLAPFAREPGSVEVLRLTLDGDAIVRFDEGCGPLPAADAGVKHPAGAEVILVGPGAAG